MANIKVGVANVGEILSVAGTYDCTASRTPDWNDVKCLPGVPVAPSRHSVLLELFHLLVRCSN